MKYVEVDPHTGDVSWDAYFEYLRAVREDFPPELYSYAANGEHYCLDGRNSLHDAWLIGVQFGYRAQEVVLAFLGAWHDRKHVLTYVGVETYALDIDVQYRSGDRDIVIHEFRVDDGLVTHEIVFSTGKSIVIRSRNVIPTTEVLS
jgi:hypothetical protein